MSAGSGNDELMDLFREEAVIHLAAMTDSLVALESAADRRSVLNDLMRAAHSMKGAARIVGLDPLVKLAHAVEDLFVASLRDEFVVDAPAVDVFLEIVDFLTAVSADPEVLRARTGEVPSLLERLEVLRRGEVASPATPAAPVAPQAPMSVPAPAATETALPSSLADMSLLELFREEAGSQLAALTDGLMALESTAQPRVVLEVLMRSAHSLKGAARIVGIDPLVKLTHVTEDLFVAALADTVAIGPGTIDILLGVVDHITDVASGDEQRVAKRLAELPELLQILTGLRAGGQPPVRSAPVASLPAPTAEAITAAVGRTAIPTTAPAAEVAQAASPAVPGKGGAQKPSAAPSRSVRMTTESLERLTSLAAESVVESERLEMLVDDARDLHDVQRDLQSVLFALREGLEGGGSSAVDAVAVRAGVEAALATFASLQERRAARETALEDYSRRSAMLARKLSRESVASRMMPFESILRGFPRLVRDVCRELGKRCRLEIRGEATLIDREVLEQLDAPLNHMVRNALDHGLEMPDVRAAAGKPAEGRLEIEAFHRAGRLQVIVRDDGRGINPENLRRSIVERGLESQENASVLSAAELYEFLFLPGFSTAKQVTELSGRGVGLDAVRTQIQGAGGSVILRSTPGAGTSFNLELPVTRSVTRALVVLIGGERYALPIANVERALVVESESLESIEGRRYFMHEGTSVALVPATEILDLPDPSHPPGKGLRVLLLMEGERRYGLVVDSFEGERSFVVRRLDQRFGEVPDVAAISTDERGGVVLILDVAELVRSMDALITGGRLLRVAGASAEATVRRKRILVVDDSLTVRQAEKQMLENQGYTVDVAVDGVEGWSAVRLTRYDLVVSDVDMPRMNGIELVKRIRADQRLQGLPVVIVSYKDREEDRIRGLEAGATHYLAKAGFQDSTLVTVVRDLIGEAVEA